MAELEVGRKYDVVVRRPDAAESEAREDKLKTPHYAYRQLTEDHRNWGSPWNIFLDPSKVKKKGDHAKSDLEIKEKTKVMRDGKVEKSKEVESDSSSESH